MYSPGYSRISGKERHKGFPVIIARTPFYEETATPVIVTCLLVFSVTRVIEKTGMTTGYGK